MTGLVVGVVTAAGMLMAPVPAATAAATASAFSAGGWTASTLPMPANAAPNNKLLMGISCSSVTQCAAAGNYTDTVFPHTTAPVVLNLSGATWVAQQAPTPAPLAPFYGAHLRGVSCPPGGRCFAVGNYENAGSLEGMVLGWDGSSWSAAQAPVPAGASPNPGTFLYGVSCATTSSCTAVGQYQDSTGNQRGILLAWNGQQWTASAAPAPPGITYLGHVVSGLEAVSCASPNACFAGGYIQDQLGSVLPYMVRWSDGAWYPVHVTLPPDAAKGKTANPQATIYGLSCASETGCVAVGNYDDSSGNQQGFLLTWNGAAWTTMKAPLPADAGSDPWVELNAVSCPTTTACYIAGSYENSASQPLGLILARTGDSWQPAASLTATYNLTGISCPAADQCLAVGWQAYSNPILVTGP